ncbi:MAG: thioredoxin family protein [Saprospiraceae bacterium]|nr:thioredoxin family protein [Saprospiraceae bacterium]MDW8229377.1 thioredoxin family protein [Saprospiraceae bacterium]
MKQALQLSLLFFLFSAVSLWAQSGGYRVGDEARDFNLKNVDGKTVSLGKMKKAKGYVVIFTCNHCPFAVAYEDRIIALHKKYAKKGFPVIAINPNDKDIQPADSYENMQKRAKEKGFPFVYLYDETQEIARAYGATRTPHVYLLDKNRRVRYIGAIDDNHEEPNAVKERYLENAIEALLAGKEVPRTETKAIGCTIKWRASAK